MLRILHIFGTAQPAGTGVVRIVQQIVRNADRSRFRFAALFLDDDGPLLQELRNDGVDVYNLRITRRTPTNAFRLWLLLRRAKADVIHQHAGGALISRIAHNATGAPIVLHLHGRVTESSSDPLPHDITPRAASAVVASSRAVAEHVRGSKVRVVYAGVELPPNPPTRRQGNDVIVGAAGRFVPIKGFETLLHATALARAKGARIKLELMGEGPEREALAGLIHDLGLQEHCALLPWEPTMENAFARWDVYALPSKEESLPIALLEAMAAGLAVVASRVGGVPEVIPSADVGILIPPGQPLALSDELCKLASLPGRRKQLGENARSRIEEEFTGKRLADEMGTIYDNVAPKYHCAAHLDFSALEFAMHALTCAMYPARLWREVRSAGGLLAYRQRVRSQLVVLLYHHVGPYREGTFPSLTVDPENFRRQLAWLEREGFHTITTAQWHGFCESGTPLPPKPILISFDDAYADLAESAFPVLDSYGMNAVVYVPTSLIGGTNLWDLSNGSAPHNLLSAEQLLHWHTRCVEFGAHGRTHASLPTLTDSVLDDEIRGSREDLAALLGSPCTSFAYPYGHCDERVRSFAGRYFPVAFGVAEGPNYLCSDRRELSRTMVHPGDTMMEFALRATLGWNPLTRPRAFIATMLRKSLWKVGSALLF